MPANLISDESFERFDKAASFVEAHSARFRLGIPDKPEDDQVFLCRGITLEKFTTNLNPTGYVMLKSRVEGWRSFVIRPVDGDGDAPSTFQIRLTFLGVNDITINRSWTAVQLESYLYAFNANLNRTNCRVFCGRNIVTADGVAAGDPEVWVISVHAGSSAANAASLDGDIEVIRDPDRPTNEIIEMSLLHDTADLREGSRVLLNYSPDAGYYPFASPGNVSLTVLGPCAAYTPAAELPDTEFDVEFPGGCDGPSRYGLNLKNLNTGLVTIIPLEYESADPLTYSTSLFTFTCASGPVSVYVKVVFNSLAVGGVVATIYDASDNPKQTFRNAIYSWETLAGGALQLGPDNEWCNCVTIPYDLCLSVPTR